MKLAWLIERRHAAAPLRALAGLPRLEGLGVTPAIPSTVAAALVRCFRLAVAPSLSSLRVAPSPSATARLTRLFVAALAPPAGGTPQKQRERNLRLCVLALQ